MLAFAVEIYWACLHGIRVSLDHIVFRLSLATLFLLDMNGNECSYFSRQNEGC